MIEISVILPAYNPPVEHLGPTLASLRAQTLPLDHWEVVIVDNRSQPPVPVDTVAWHPHGRVLREETPGLVAARAAGFRASCGEVLVVVDQDNLLAPDFLATAREIGEQRPWLGTWGAGIISPHYERPELAPPAALHSLLTLRHSTRNLWSNDINHHDSTPWGAGLCVRRLVATAYLEALRGNPLKGKLDLCGDRRLAGGDTDISYTGCALGLGKGIFTSLQLEHLIPAARCTERYLCKTAEDRGYSDVIHEKILTGKVTVPRPDPLARLRLFWHTRGMTPLERKVHAATLAGRRRARVELAGPEPSL